LPIACSYYVTTVCNAKCGFCDIWEGPAHKKPKLVSMEHAEKIIRGLKKLGVRYIDFTGGEPLLQRNLPELLAIAKKIGLKTGLVSNGYLYPARAHEFIDLVDSASFSLDSSDRDRHNASRKLQCYDRVIESIELAKRNKQFVNINFSVGNENMDEIPGMMALAKELRTVVHVMPMFGYFGNPALDAELTRQLKYLHKQPYMSVNLAAIKFQAEGGNDPEKPKCKAIKANVAVSQDGKYLLPCYHAAQERMDIDVEDPVGQWKSPAMQEHIKKSGRYDFCKGCTIWCYMTPSFMYTLDSYFLLQAYSYAKDWAKLSSNRMRDAIKYGREVTREELIAENQPVSVLGE